MIKSKFIIIIVISPLLLSCSQLRQPASSNVARVFSEKSARVSQKPVANPTTDTMPPDSRYPATASRFSARRPFYVSVHEVDAREFFMGLVVDSDENIVVHPEVKGLISLELKNVTVPQVLEAVQKVYGYDYKKTDIGYVIYPATLQTKTFKIDRLDLLREGKSNTYVSSGQTANSNQGYGNQQYQSPMQQPVMGQLNGNNISSGTRTSGSSITTTTQTDFWKELEEALRTLISIDRSHSRNQQAVWCCDCTGKAYAASRN
jgi:MSHA biogenesis protein MshL